MTLTCVLTLEPNADERPWAARHLPLELGDLVLSGHRIRNNLSANLTLNEINRVNQWRRFEPRIKTRSIVSLDGKDAPQRLNTLKFLAEAGWVWAGKCGFSLELGDQLNSSVYRLPRQIHYDQLSNLFDGQWLNSQPCQWVTFNTIRYELKNVETRLFPRPDSDYQGAGGFFATFRVYAPSETCAIMLVMFHLAEDGAQWVGCDSIQQCPEDSHSHPLVTHEGRIFFPSNA